MQDLTPTWLRRRFWSWHARNWDALYSASDVVAHYDEVVAWVNDTASPAGRLLDIGCGTGRHSVPLALRGFDVVGVDFAPGMLARAAARAAQHGAELDLRQLDIRTRLPFADASFDAAVCSYVLQTIGDPAGLLHEARRVLRHDGVLMVEVPVRRPAPAEVARSPTSRLLLLVKRVGSRLPGAVRIHCDETLQDELRDSGFSVVEARSFRRSLGVLARS